MNKHNQAGTTFNNVAANFFLMKGRPPKLSSAQIFKFMKAFFGCLADDEDEVQTFEGHDIQQRRALYHQGYK